LIKSDGRYLFLTIVLEKLDDITLIGIVNIKRPLIEVIKANIFPAIVIGRMSPF
jgi:hypothetical protein